MLIETKQIEVSVGAQVRNIKNGREPGCVVQEYEFRCRIPEPNQRLGYRPREGRFDVGENQVERTVVVEVGDFEPHLARQGGSGIGNFDERRNVPPARFFERNADDRTTRFDGEQIENAIVVGIRNTKSLDSWQARWKRDLSELALPLVVKNMKAPIAIDNCRIGIAICIEIRPSECAHSRHARERLNYREGIVAIVSQHLRSAVFFSKNDVQVAVGLDVYGPRPGVGRVRNAFWQLGVLGDIGEFRRTVLPHQAHATLAGKYEVGLEVVVEIDLQDALWKRPGSRSTTGKREYRAGRQTHFVTIRLSDYGGSRAPERNSAYPLPLASISIRNRLRDKRERGVCWRRGEVRYFQTQEMSEGLGFFTRGSLQHS